MSKLLDGILGEYIYISNDIIPATAIFYKDKKVLKSETVYNILDYTQKLLDRLKIVDDDMWYEINHNEAIKENLHEIIIYNKGIRRFSTHSGMIRFTGDNKL